MERSPLPFLLLDKLKVTFDENVNVLKRSYKGDISDLFPKLKAYIGYVTHTESLGYGTVI